MEERETKKNKKKMKMNTNTLKMGRWRVWLCFKETFLVPTKCLLLKVTTPCSRHKAKGKSFINSIKIVLLLILCSCSSYLVLVLSLTW